MPFPQILERTLEAAAARQKIAHSARSPAVATRVAESRFPLTQLVAMVIPDGLANDEPDGVLPLCGPGIELASARRVLAALERYIGEGSNFQTMAAAVTIEIAIAEAEDEIEQTVLRSTDPLFRFCTQRLGIAEGDVALLVPVRNPQIGILEFGHDVADFLGARRLADFPVVMRSKASHLVVFRQPRERRRSPLLVDPSTAHILMLSDGTRTALDIARASSRSHDLSTHSHNLKWIERLFVDGLIELRDSRIDGATQGASDGAASAGKSWA